MAGIYCRANAENITTGTALKTILQVAAASNHRIKILEWGISFNGIVVTDAPVNVHVVRQTSAGTGGVAVTEMLLDDDVSETIQTTALAGPAGSTWTGEPTLDSPPNILYIVDVHPQSGYTYNMTRTNLYVGGGDRLAIMTTAAVAVNCSAFFEWEE